jgi:hypothetical protein
MDAFIGALTRNGLLNEETARDPVKRREVMERLQKTEELYQQGTVPVQLLDALIVSRNPRVFKKNGKILSVSNQCILCALFNAKHAYSSLSLHPVVGSLGVGTENPYYEYGNPMWSTAEQFHMGMTTFDCHVWLEDARGRVYDVVTGPMAAAALLQQRKILVKPGLVLEEVEKEKCLRLGLSYVAAPASIQGELLSMIKTTHRVRLERHGLLDEGAQ